MEGEEQLGKNETKLKQAVVENFPELMVLMMRSRMKSFLQ